MSSSPSSSPPPPEGPRFSEYTADNHQAPLWIAALITLVYSFLFLIVRLVIKIKVLALDDAFLGCGYIFSVAQWATTFVALGDGVGKVLSNGGASSESMAAKLVFVSRILTLLTLSFTQCSVILFLRQVFVGTISKSWNICSALLIASASFAIAALLTVSVQCPSGDMLLPESQEKCSGDLARWIVVAVLYVILELVLVLTPAYLFSSVQITRSRKFIIFGSFVPRLAVPAILIAYVQAYYHYRKHSGTSIGIVSTLVWQQILCGYSLVSATIPCLKGFLGRFRTEDLARVTESGTGSRTYGHSTPQRSRVRTNHESFVLESLDRKLTRKKKEPAEDSLQLAGRPAELIHSATAYAENGENGDGSVKSFGSDRMMIHRKVEYDVTTS